MRTLALNLKKKGKMQSNTNNGQGMTSVFFTSKLRYLTSKKKTKEEILDNVSCRILLL
jgi:hypothetical protein